jgi:hypothetical protein
MQLSREALDTWWYSTNSGRLRRCQHLIGDSVRLLLEAVAWLIDRELGLDQSPLHGLIPHRDWRCARGMRLGANRA